MTALWRMVTPGGMLVIDHYTWTLSRFTKLAMLYRPIVKRLPPDRAKQVVDSLVNLFFPLHWAVRHMKPLQMLLSRVSPCHTYCHVYPELTREQHEDWCRLDTFDGLTDRYKRLRSVRAIRRRLEALGGVNIWCERGGNGVEARARRVCAE